MLNKMSVVLRIIQVLSGYDFGFFNFKSALTRLIFKILSLAICVVLSCISLTISSQNNNVYSWFIIFQVQYISTVLFLAFLKPNDSFYGFYSELSSIDARHGVDCNYFKIEIKMLSTICALILFRCILVVVHTFINVKASGLMFLASVYARTITSTHIVVISYTFLFYSAICRLKHLESILKGSEPDFLNTQLLYKMYVEIIEKYKKRFDPLFIITLVCNITEVMCTMYSTLKQIRYNNLSIHECIWHLNNIFVLEALMVTFAPAICAGLLAIHADRIKLTLNEKLLYRQEPAKAYQIQRFIRYVGARGCRFRVYKVIPLDADLIGMALSFCVTYLIVIIQFTHVF